MTSTEKHMSKSNTWNNLRKKLKVLWWASALSLLITLNGCGPADLNVKKAADKFQEKTEKVDKLKKKLKNKEKDLKELQEEIKKTEWDITDAEKEAAEAKDELQKESGNL
jgi:peptidoglycan hydrolase CwlO-like protein